MAIGGIREKSFVAGFWHVLCKPFGSITHPSSIGAADHAQSLTKLLVEMTRLR
jgi:hypothetical protein